MTHKLDRLNEWLSLCSFQIKMKIYLFKKLKNWKHFFSLIIQPSNKVFNQRSSQILKPLSERISLFFIKKWISFKSMKITKKKLVGGYTFFKNKFCSKDWSFRVYHFRIYFYLIFFSIIERIKIFDSLIFFLFFISFSN